MVHSHELMGMTRFIILRSLCFVLLLCTLHGLDFGSFLGQCFEASKFLEGVVKSLRAVWLHACGMVLVQS